MKTKTSITLAGSVLRGIDAHLHEHRSRSEFIEAAVLCFVKHIERQEAERRDLEILNRHSGSLNREATDVLTYQAPL